MSAAPFTITYIGGGSRFVTTLLHGLAWQAEVLQKKDRAIQLNLYDLNREAAGEKAAYGEIVAQASGIPLSCSVFEHLDEALAGSHLVIMSAHLEEQSEAGRICADVLGAGEHPSEGFAGAVYSAAQYPFLLDVSSRMRKQAAPNASLCILTNPTDTLAAALQQRTGIPTFGLCVEVEGLLDALCYYLHMDRNQWAFTHIGVNHSGWILDIQIDGQPPTSAWLEQLEQVDQMEDFHPASDALLPLYRLTGYLPTSGYHRWPYQSDGYPDWNQRIAHFAPRNQNRLNQFQHALEERRMIPHDWQTHPELTNFSYPGTGRVLGRLIAGLAGCGQTDTVLQVRNGRASTDFPEDAWLELSCTVTADGWKPLPVEQAPDWLLLPLKSMAEQRRQMARFLVTGDPMYLRAGFNALPYHMTVQKAMKVIDRTVSFYQQLMRKYDI